MTSKAIPHGRGLMQQKKRDMRSSTLPQSLLLDSYRLVPVGLYVGKGFCELFLNMLPKALLPCEIGVGEGSKLISGVGVGVK